LQLTLFAADDHPLLEEIRGIDLNNMTPLEAMKRIDQWRETLAEEAVAKPR